MKPIAFNENDIAHSDSPMLEPEQSELLPAKVAIRIAEQDEAFMERIDQEYPKSAQSTHEK